MGKVWGRCKGEIWVFKKGNCYSSISSKKILVGILKLSFPQLKLTYFIITIENLLWMITNTTI